MPKRITYLNTDLDLFSTEDLTGLAAALKSRGMSIHHVGQEPDGTWRAHFGPDVQMDAPEYTISIILDAIETLPDPEKTVWAACKRREFNIGYDCGVQPRAFEQNLSSELIGRMAGFSAGIGITLYADSPD